MIKYTLGKWLVFIGYFLGVSILLRLIFFFLFREDHHSFWQGDVFYAFYLGAKFDTRAILMIFSLSSLPFLFPVTYKAGKNLTKRCFSLLFFAALTFFFAIYASDFGHYSYLKTRLSGGVIDLIENPWISAMMVWQSYPVIWGALVLFLFLFSHLYFYNRFLKYTVDKISEQRTVAMGLINGFLIILISGLLSYGKVSFFPLRWSEAFFSKDKFISAVASNPFISFLSTFSHRDDDYDMDKVQASYPLVAEFLGLSQNHSRSFEKGLLDRSYQFADKLRPYNVVVILLESLAYDKSSLSSNPLNPTPYIAELAKDSWYFPFCYTPTEATARGVFATITGVADVTLMKSSSRNPFAIDHQTIMDQFSDYERFYFLGGSANWGNIRALFTNNIRNIQMYEEEKFDKSKRVDVWGLSDLQLFKEAHRVFREQRKPFVAFIQSAGFHRPYTIPKDRDDFKPIEGISKEQLNNYGFDSLEQLNSIRFQDYALQRFFELAKQESYFQNTLFVMLGDHGLPSPKSLHVPSGFYRHRLVNHHVPLLFHQPSVIDAKQEDDIIASQLDVFPTVAGLLNMPYQTRTLGRDLAIPREPEQNYAFLFTWHKKPYWIGLIGQDFFYEESGEGDFGLYQHKSEQPLDDVTSDYPQKAEFMMELSQSLYYTSQYLLLNNKKQQQDQSLWK